MRQRHSRMPLVLLLTLAWRNLWRHRRRTLITLSSIALGFGMAVFSIGIGDGSHNSMIRNAIKLGQGHLAVQPTDYQEAPANHKFIADGRATQAKLDALNIEGRVSPRISLQVLASTANNSVGAALEGMAMDVDPRKAMLQPKLVAGEWIKPGTIAASSSATAWRASSRSKSGARWC